MRIFYCFLHKIRATQLLALTTTSLPEVFFHAIDAEYAPASEHPTFSGYRLPVPLPPIVYPIIPTASYPVGISAVKGTVTTELAVTVTLELFLPITVSTPPYIHRYLHVLFLLVPVEIIVEIIFCKSLVCFFICRVFSLPFSRFWFYPFSTGQRL